MNYREKYALAIMLTCILAGSLSLTSDTVRTFVMFVFIAAFMLFAHTPKG